MNCQVQWRDQPGVMPWQAPSETGLGEGNSNCPPRNLFLSPLTGMLAEASHLHVTFPSPLVTFQQVLEKKIKVQSLASLHPGLPPSTLLRAQPFGIQMIIFCYLKYFYHHKAQAVDCERRYVFSFCFGISQVTFQSQVLLDCCVYTVGQEVVLKKKLSHVMWKKDFLSTIVKGVSLVFDMAIPAKIKCL